MTAGEHSLETRVCPADGGGKCVVIVQVTYAKALWEFNIKKGTPEGAPFL
ncbi:hypothetical protein ACI01nite_09260 [Acetobacter cibinongensis]|uniref:Uncharacterized protein n=1 Tax=Acetobacter cibinongensis TaxID=146475 RepID=A0A0D6N382_9PROT|nr:hypothetical protein Abci_010_045 [Acetobacter cibinongensis]GBQ17996.1 hypothetical protein AA0482_2094 [Acetobacter cibinongensis NRIC 0482]GEL58324.1 hypothetical protein ACI01nite_09260 [Acetobacter cibinongensis]